MKDITRCIGTVGYLGGLMALPEEFCWAWGEMREFNTAFTCGQGEHLHYTRSRFSLHAGARNYLVNELRGDWLIMFDTDVIFPPETVLQLLTLHRRTHAPIITGIVRHKAKPHHPLLWIWHEGEHQQGLIPLLEIGPEPLVRVDAAGGGCLFVHCSVFTQLATLFPEVEPFDHFQKYGEDLSFFLRCRTAGIPVYAAPQVEVTHLMMRGITAEDYEPAWYPGTTDIELQAVKA